MSRDLTMPIASCPRDALYERLGRTYTEDELNEVLFEFGIELDDVEMPTEEDPDAEVVFKIEVPNNRHDLLCLEGLSRALAVFTGTASPPSYTLTSPSSLLEMTVEVPVSTVRPYVVCAALRGFTMTERNYKSFLDLQARRLPRARARPAVVIPPSAPLYYAPPSPATAAPRHHATTPRMRARRTSSTTTSRGAARSLRSAHTTWTR